MLAFPRHLLRSLESFARLEVTQQRFTLWRELSVVLFFVFFSDQNIRGPDDESFGFLAKYMQTKESFGHVSRCRRRMKSSRASKQSFRRFLRVILWRGKIDGFLWQGCASTRLSKIYQNLINRTEQFWFGTWMHLRGPLILWWFRKGYHIFNDISGLGRVVKYSSILHGPTYWKSLGRCSSFHSFSITFISTVWPLSDDVRWPTSPSN